MKRSKIAHQEDGRLKRLPKWAQDHIRWLQQQLKAYQRDLRQAMGSSRAAVLFVRDPDDVSRYHPIPGKSVRVEVSENFFIDIVQRQEDEGVGVTIYGSSAVYIEPSAANNFRILQRPR